MRQGKFLFVILSLVGASEVMGQWSTGNPTITSYNVGIGITTSTTLAKLHAITNSGPSAIFQNATTTSGAGNVGIGGLSTSFTNTSLPTYLLQIRDGNMWIQRGTFRVSAVNATDDAILVSNGITRLTGGLYAGAQTPGLSGSMEYNFSQGYFELSSRANTNNYQFKIGSRVNNVDVGAPVLSTTTSMLFQTNSGLGTTAYNFKFLNGNTDLLTITNSGNMTLAAITGYDGKINAQQLNLYNSIGDGYDYGAIRMGQSGTNFWHIGQANDNSFRIMRCSGTNFLTSLVLDYTTGNIKIANRVDIGDKKYLPTDATVKLGVAGTIVAQKVKVTAANWGDFVFDKNYALQPLAEVEQYVKDNKHLPNIPSATELEASGIDTGEMLRLQMIKIEELTLHLIEQQKRTEVLEEKLAILLQK